MSARTRLPIVVSACLIPWTLTSVAMAEVQTYTDRASFLAALPSANGETTITFETIDAGSHIESGDSIGGVGFDYAIADRVLAVTQAHDQVTLDGRQSLGLAPSVSATTSMPFDSAFLSGDALSLTFDEPVTAVGLSVIASPGDLRAGDVQLSFADGQVVNDPGPAFVLPDGGQVFFLGIIADARSIDAQPAVLESFDPERSGLFIFNVDDIVGVAATATDARTFGRRSPRADEAFALPRETLGTRTPVRGFDDDREPVRLAERENSKFDDNLQAQTAPDETADDGVVDDTAFPFVGPCWPVGIVGYSGMLLGWIGLVCLTRRR